MQAIVWAGPIYALVIFLSNTIGAISGMGGGIVIKPALDAIGFHNLVSISFFSCSAVFAMSISSSIRQIKSGAKINIKNVLGISLGSVGGGLLGEQMFQSLLDSYPEEHVELLQNILMIASLVLVLVYTLRGASGGAERRVLKHTAWYVAAGLFLGMFSTLLGIGGGPINVALLMILFGMHIKRAVVYSIITIFFSQLSKLVSIGLTTGFASFDLAILLWIIPAALLGGYVGGRISGKISDKKVTLIYNLVVAGVIAVNIWNIVTILMQW